MLVKLPAVVVSLYVCPFLDIQTLCRLSQCSHSCRKSADSQYVWKLRYIENRRDALEIADDSVHRPNCYCYTTKYTSKKCNLKSHYFAETLVTSGRRVVNYHNFKRATAKAICSKSRPNKGDIRREIEWMQRMCPRLFEGTLTEWDEQMPRVKHFRRRLWTLERKKRKLASFDCILALPTSTPPYLVVKRKRKEL